MATKYPNTIDDDSTLPSVTDNLTEVGGEAINGLKDAVLTIEKTVGTRPQGNKSSLNDRVNVSIDADGNLKTSALSAKGLVTLPITNAHIGNTAAIAESKLDLDYSTASLKSSLNSLSTSVSSVQSTVGASVNAFNKHIYGIDYFHDGYDIKINKPGQIQQGIAGLGATTVNDALIELGTILFGNGVKPPHIDVDLPIGINHKASEISVNSSGFEMIDNSVANVQEAFDSLDEEQKSFLSNHIDTFHANGILREIKSGSYYNANDQKINSAIISYTAGSSVVTVTGVTSFSDLGVSAGDILSIGGSVADTGVFKIRAVGTLTSVQTLGDLPALSASQLAVFHVFLETKTDSIGSVFGPESISSDNATLACSHKYHDSTASTITILNPNAARVVSLGFNGSIINGAGYNLGVQVGVGNGIKRSINITNLNYDLLGTDQAEPVDASSVAERINAFVSYPGIGYAHHFPISAFKVGNELAIAHNWVGADYTLEILDGYSANYALGFDDSGADVAGKEVHGNESNSFVVGGLELSTLRTALTAQSIVSTDTTVLTITDSNLVVINPLLYGIKEGSVAHITGHSVISANGSYVLANSSSTTITLAETIPASLTTVTITFSDSHVSLKDVGGAESNKGIVGVTIDSDGKVDLHERLLWSNNGDGFIAGIEIIDASETLPSGTYTLVVGVTGPLAIFSFVDGTGLSGDTVTVRVDFAGTFKLYHSNNLDYIVINVLNTIAGLVGGTDAIIVKDQINYDESMVLCNVCFDGSGTDCVTHMFDTRLAGNIGPNQIREDFIEIYTQKPMDDTRTNGVVRGLDVLPLTYQDVETGLPALPLSGGIVYINGARVSVQTQKVIVQPDDEFGNMIQDQQIIAINEFGSLQAFTDDLGEMLVDGYESSSAYGKVLPLYRVILNSSGAITSYVDLRRFINKLDNKIDFVVDGSNYNSIGSFKTLNGAVEYIAHYPNSEKSVIKVVGQVNCSTNIILPNGVSLVGVGNAKITNTGAQGDFIELKGKNTINNISFYSSNATLFGSFIKVTGTNIDILDCTFDFDFNISTNDDNVAIIVYSEENVIIKNNKIHGCFSGIESLQGCNNLIIQNNIIDGVAGTSVLSYGIRISSLDRTSDFINIEGNKITIPSVPSDSSIIGIAVNVEEDINSLRIINNDILHTAANSVIGGIQIDNENATGNTAFDVIISHNNVNGVKRDTTNTFGIFVSDCENVSLDHNTINNIGVAGNTGVCGIQIDGGNLKVSVGQNTIKDSVLNYGIYVNDSAVKISIFDNHIQSVSISAQYISGDANYAKIENNMLIGPGDYGIYWSGSYAQVSNNKLDKPGSGITNYSFKSYGIHSINLGTDISGNMISGMEYDDGIVTPIGIYCHGGSCKVNNNTVSGTKIGTLLDIGDTYNIVSANKLYNLAANVSSTYFILLDDASYSLISNNHTSGTGSYSVYSSSDPLTGVSIVNNSLVATACPIRLSATDDEATVECLVVGNKLPYNGGSSESVIGISPSVTDINTNTIGINAGLLAYKSVPASEIISGYDGASTLFHWWMDGTNKYWSSNTAAIDKYLYIPIKGLTDGSRIVSVDIMGAKADGNWTFYLYNFSNSTRVFTALVTDSTALSAGDFTRNLDTNDTVVNNYESSYFVAIKLDSATSASNFVYGARINFRY